ncbi:response regulator [Paenibacillus filicis]|uniref:Response regulator n=1 Tax=Paenibacillus filicis TaxID=669464 RepID=A0ABU9DKF1_9BACL
MLIFPNTQSNLKVMLVDDEYMVLDTLISKVRWSLLGMEVVATAANGQQALEKCAMHKPDLILTDLTMPVMDGLELIATLRRDFTDVRFAVLTAHKEFDYAQRAVELKALSYLLKTPMNTEDIEHTLRACAETIRSERSLHSRARYAEQMMAQHAWEIRRRALGDLLRGMHIGDRQLGELFPWIGSAGARPVVLGIYVTVLHRHEFYARYPEADHALLDYTMLQVAYEIVQELAEGTVLPYRPGEAMLVLGLSAYEGQAQSEGIVQQLHQRLTRWLHKYFGVSVIFGIGSAASGISSLRRTLQEAMLAAEAAFYEQGPIHRHLDFRIKVWDRIDPQGWAVLESKARAAWSSPDIDERLGGLRDFAASVKAHRPHPGTLKQRTALWLEEAGAVSLSRNDWIALADNSAMEPWLETLEALLVRLPRHASGGREGLHPDIQKAVEFILKHLGENLTLTRVAEHIHMNPSYLSHLFKEETGDNFLDFVTFQRIGKAKEYLASAKYKNYELAEKIGFVSYPHFCTVFKKMTGLTPSEYKKSLHA